MVNRLTFFGRLARTSPLVIWLPGFLRGFDRLDIAPALLFLTTCAVVLPYLTLHDLPLVDLPNHLARWHVLAARPASPPAQSYSPHWALMPDLGCDLIYVALKDVFSPEMVARLCLAGAVLVTVAAIWRIQRVLHGTTSIAVAVSPLLVTSLPAYMGYLNYLLSVAFAFAGLALYLSWREYISPLRIGCLSAIATACWFAHIAGFAVFGLVLSVIHLGPMVRQCWVGGLRRLRRTVRALAVLFAVFAPGLLLSLAAERQVSRHILFYGGLLKLRSLLAPWLATGSSLDMLPLPFFFAAALLARRFGSLSLSPVTKPAILALSVLIAVLPWQVGDAVDVDARLVLPLTALVLASLRIRVPTRPLMRPVCFGVVTLLSMVRVYNFERSGRELSHEIAAFRATEWAIPLGSAVMVARDTSPATCGSADRTRPPLTHLASYATIDRGAYVPTIFNSAGMQPLRAIKPGFPASERAITPPTFDLLTLITEAGGALALSRTPPANKALARELRFMIETQNAGFLQQWPEHYGALLVLHGGCARNLMPSRLMPVGGGDFFELYLLHRPVRTRWQAAEK